MKKPTILLQLAGAAAILAGHAVPAAAQQFQDMKVEPVMAVRHSLPGVDAWYQLGRQHQEGDRLDQARDAFLQVLEQEPDHVNARNALGAVYSMQGKLDEAVAQFQKVLASHPGLPYVYNNLGFAYYLKNDYPKAVIAFANALVLEPHNARAYGNLNQAYALLPPAAAALPKTAGPAETAAPAAMQPSMASAPGSATPSVVNPLAAAALPAPTRAAPASPPQEPAPAAEPAAAGVTIEIANGTPDPRLAEYLAEALRRDGVAVSRVTELKPHTQRRTVIFYRDGFRDHALALSRAFALPTTVENNTRTRSPSDSSDVRLVLGRSALEALQGKTEMVAQAGRR